jgi:HK97 family phage portal protein
MAKLNFLDKILGTLGLIRKKAADFPLVSGAGISDFIIGGGVRIPKSKLLENNKNWVFSCVRARAEAVGNIKLKMFEKKKDGTVAEVPEHELLDLLAAVNPFMTQFECFEMLESHLDLTGNAYWYLDGVKNYGDKPTAIYPLNPKYVEIKKGRLPNFIDEYRYTVNSVVQIIKPEQILHFREANPDDPYEGRGILEAIAHWVDADNYATEWNRTFFLNAARPDATLEHEADLSAEQMNFLRASFEDTYRGVEKAHKALILPKGVKFSPVGWNQKEMDFVEMQRMTRDKILAGFRVPKTILGLTEDVNRANAEASNYVFALRVIKPQMERIVGYINEFLVPRYGDNIFLDFEDPVPENRELELLENEKALGAQAYASVNEIREKEGLPPIEDGDSVMTNFSLLPLGKPIEKTKTKPNIKNQMKPSVRFSRNLKKRKEIGELIAKEAMSIVRESAKKILDKLDEERWEILWKAFVARVTPYEKTLAGKIKSFNKDQKEKVIKKLEGKIKAVKAPEDFGDLFNGDEEVSILIDGITPILRELYQKEGKETLDLIGMGEAFEASLERARKSLDDAISLMSESYNETTLDLLKEKLKEGLQNGESLPELTNRIRDVYEFSDQVRAERVARTEAFRVANSATREAWRQSGVVKTLKFYTAADESVCPVCAAMNGKIVGIEEEFFKPGEEVAGSDGKKYQLSSYSDGMTPQDLHPNCRCYLRPETINIE